LFFMVLLAMVATDEIYAQPTILSAYLGILDTVPALQFQQVTGCLAADSPQTLIDGMPITFNVPVDPATISPDKFKIISKDLTVHTPACATIRPAGPTGTTELFTVLLTGEFASAVLDPNGTPPPLQDGWPILVKVVPGDEDDDDGLECTEDDKSKSNKYERKLYGGDRLMSLDGEDLTGLYTTDITSFIDGVELEIARLLSPQQMQLVFSGGVTGFNSTTPGIAALNNIILHDGCNMEDVNPTGFDPSDLGDTDNFLTVNIPSTVSASCIDQVSVEPSTFFDPSNRPNPATSILVSGGAP